MDIEEFDVLDQDRARELLLSCAAVPRWADALVTGRPYADPAALVGRADELAATWTGDEVVTALADHPRIGERHSGTGSSAAHSTREQAGVAGTDDDVAARIAQGNRDYEARFDRIFLVRAAGRSAEEILAQLEQRLGNDPATELDVTTGQLREIAVLRVRSLVGA